MSLHTRWMIERGIAMLAALLAVLTAVVPDWIELSGVDPDAHSGAFEWVVVGALVVTAACSSWIARRDGARLADQR